MTRDCLDSLHILVEPGMENQARIHVTLRNGNSVFLCYNLILSDKVIGNYNSIWMGVGIRKLDISHTQSFMPNRSALASAAAFSKNTLNSQRIAY